MGRILATTVLAAAMAVGLQVSMADRSRATSVMQAIQSCRGLAKQD